MQKNVILLKAIPLQACTNP